MQVQRERGANGKRMQAAHAASGTIQARSPDVVAPTCNEEAAFAATPRRLGTQRDTTRPEWRMSLARIEDECEASSRAKDAMVVRMAWERWRGPLKRWSVQP